MQPQQIADLFNARAQKYAHDEWHQRYAEQLIAVTPLRVGDRVLDAGAGTGFAARAAARRIGPSGSVLAADLSPAMLEQARIAADTERLRNITCRVADVSELRDLADATFDVVVCSAGLLYMPVAKCLREWHRLLKKDGVVAFSAMREGFPAPGRIFRECAARFGVHVRDRMQELGTEDRCRRALADSGFETTAFIPARVDFTELDLGLAWESSFRAAGDAGRALTNPQLDELRRQYFSALSLAREEDSESLGRVEAIFAIGTRR